MTGIAFVKIGSKEMSFKAKKDKWGELEIRIPEKELHKLKLIQLYDEAQKADQKKIAELQETVTQLQEVIAALEEQAHKKKGVFTKLIDGVVSEKARFVACLIGRQYEKIVKAVKLK